MKCDCYELVSKSKFISSVSTLRTRYICERDMPSEPLEVETFNLMLNYSKPLRAIRAYITWSALS